MENSDLQFNNALHMACSVEKAGIGTLSEKTLHAFLKFYFEPDAAKHEIRLGPYVADIYNEKGITEIQTGSFNQLREKLNVFLNENKVRIVYPVAAIKYLTWVDPKSGEISKKRKSGKKGGAYEILPHLYQIKYLLNHSNLRLTVILLELDEYRPLDGWGADRKGRASKGEKIPVGIVEILDVASFNDYKSLLPSGLSKEFTSADFMAKTRFKSRKTGYALSILTEAGVVKRIGKKGRRFLYCMSELL